MKWEEDGQSLRCTVEKEGDSRGLPGSRQAGGLSYHEGLVLFLTQC